MKSRTLIWAGAALTLCVCVVMGVRAVYAPSHTQLRTIQGATDIPEVSDAQEEVCYVRVVIPSPTPKHQDKTDPTDTALYALAEQNDVILPKNLSPTRKAILKAAFAGTLHGVPYYYTWRSYGVAPGLKVNEFGTELGVSDGNPNRTEKGLDCSGFVGWSYATAGVNTFACGGDAETGFIFLATPGMRQVGGMTEITGEDLQPADIGFISNTAGGKSDHTGIFLGINSEGVNVWIHCSGSQGAVCNTYGGFQVFYTLEGLDE